MGEVLGKGRPYYDVEMERLKKKKELTKKPSKIKPKSVLRLRSKELKMQALKAKEEAGPSIGEVLDPEMGKKKKEKKIPTIAELEALPVDVSRLDLRIGRLLYSQAHPFDKDYYLTHIHLDSPQPILCVAKLAKYFHDDDLGDDKDALILCNHKPYVVVGMPTEHVILCAVKGDVMEMLSAAHDVDTNSKVFVPGYPRRPDRPYMRPWMDIMETVTPDLWVNDQRQVTYKGIPLQVKGLRGQYSHVMTSTLTDCPVQMV